MEEWVYLVFPTWKTGSLMLYSSHENHARVSTRKPVKEPIYQTGDRSTRGGTGLELLHGDA